MLRIIKKKVIITNELQSKIRVACSFANCSFEIIEGTLRIIEKTNLAYVEPHRVIIKERLEDAKVRYKDKPLSVWSNEEKANHLIECSLNIEKQIMKYCNIEPEDINDESIEKYIKKLKEFDM